MEEWTKLKIFMKKETCEKSIDKARKRFEFLDDIIQKTCAEKNVKMVKDHISNFTLNGKFSQTGMWKLRKKLHPQQLDPPMAKLDKKGNVITAPALLRNLYLETYVDRLRHREMKPEFNDIFEMKMKLWRWQCDVMKTKKSAKWKIEDLNKVLKNLKNNKSRDPQGYINEIFKPNICGSNLRDGILQLANEMKTELKFPAFMQLANVTTIFKSKGSRMSLESDRGIFVTSVLKRAIDGLIYSDKYNDIDSGMSDSNIGGRRKMNIKNHLFIIYGVMNSVVWGEDDPIDLQIYDLLKCFDALWLEDCMIDMVDSIPPSSQDDKIAMVYEANKSNLVAINTAVGQTDRVEIPCIVMQGGTWGPLQCSNSIDKIGKKCSDRGQHLYKYKGLAQVLPLGMVDDLIGISTCGHKSVELNTFITTQVELKKLKFHVPDVNGKSKCNQIHIGKSSEFCPTLKIHGYEMLKVSQDTYLGDIISSDASNKPNIKDRVGKGVGKMTEILNILDTVSFGACFFQIFNLLRESMFVNGTLTNAEIWYGLEPEDLKELDDLDRLMIRKVLKCPSTTPTEAGHLELGLLPLHCIVKERRVNFLHSLLNIDDDKMLSKFFKTQLEHPTKRDWTESIKKDMSDLKINLSFSEIKSKSSLSFKNMVKIKVKEFALDLLNMKKFDHSKMDDLVFTELKIQKYLLAEELSVNQKQTIFAFRTRMSDFSENFRNGGPSTPCKICNLHIDSQAHGVNCPEVLKNVNKTGNYQEIFTDNISSDTATMLEAIMKYRKNKLG